MSAPQVAEKGKEWLGNAPNRGAPPPRGPNDPAPNAGIKAIDPDTGKTVWDFKLFQGSIGNGVLATAGGLLFASSRDGNVIALDAMTGKDLWHYQNYQTGGNHSASPISCGVDGRQYVRSRPATCSTASRCRSSHSSPSSRVAAEMPSGLSCRRRNQGASVSAGRTASTLIWVSLHSLHR